MSRIDFRSGSVARSDSLTLATSSAGMASLGPNTAFIPTDPKFGEQWHLLNNGKSGGTPGIDINITDVWNDYTGSGVIIGIIDDGVLHSHPDLSVNYDTTLDHDARDADNDATAGTSDSHGTAVAGVIAGVEGNGIGVTGVAFDATIAGFRMGFGPNGSNQQIVENLTLQTNVDISNNSWGFGGFFSDDFSTPAFSPMGDAILNAVTEGRDGLGTVVVFAAGNERAGGQDANYHNFQNSPHTIAVAALDHNGQVADFSTPGAPILVSAPGVNISTTYSFYGSPAYATINGTSFSSPITSGVVALMLEANPELGYRDVQEILAYSARQTDANSPGWDVNGATNWNGGGLHVSHDYGYGLIDAYSAVRLAETWELTSTQANLVTATASSSPALAILDYATATDTVTISSGLRIDHVEVDLDLTHTWIGDLAVSLTSPDNTTSILVNRPGFGWVSQDEINFTASSTHNWGETGAGAWTLNVTDSGPGDQGVLNSWTLRLLGDVINTDDTYIYTDEFGAFTGAGNAARRLLSDPEGSDTLNAAAITSDSVIDLNPGAVGTLAGNSLAIAAGTVIENAYAGDGNDLLTGNLFDNSLYGGRGNDFLMGGGGNDQLVGGSGDDILSGGGGNDFFDAGSGTNTIIVGANGANDTILVGNESLSTDKLQFDSGIGMGDVGFTQGGNDLIISLSATHGGGAVTVSNFFAERGGQRIDEIQFDGGATTLSVAGYTQLSDFPALITNETPTVSDQGFSLNENSEVGSVLGTVVASDPNVGDVLGYTITAGNDGGAFSINAGNGQVTVAGALDFEGQNAYALTVGVTDSGLLSDSATVSISINDLNETPTIGEQSFTVDENMALNSVVGSVASSDPDAGEVLSYAITAGNEGGAFSIGAGTGQVTVQSALDFEALNTYSLTVSVTDRGLLSDSAAVSVGLTDINEAPTVSDQGFTVAENAAPGTVVGTVIASDPDAGDVLRYAITAGNGDGTFAIGANGVITAQNVLDFEGLDSTNYALSVQVSDNGLLYDTAEIAVRMNDAPNTSGDSASTSEDTAVTVLASTLLANDSDIDGDTLSISGVSNAVNGAVALNGDGNVVFTPAADFNGAATFDYTVSDGNGGTATQTVSVDVTAVNDAPNVDMTSPVSLSLAEDGTLLITQADFLSNASDIEGDTLSVSGVAVDSGTITDDGDGTWAFAPGADFNGSVTLSYNVSDGTNSVADAGTITVTAVNDAPNVDMTSPVSLSLAEDGTLLITQADFLSNATDVDGDTLSVSGVTVDSGTVTDNGDGTWAFAPGADFNGSVTLSYNVSDGTNSVADAGTITVTAVNDAPDTLTDSAGTNEDSAVTILTSALLNNDSDVEGDTLTLTGVFNALGGSVNLDGNGDVVFTPTADFNGSASFDYTVSDGNGGTATQTVTVDVTAVNDAAVVSGPVMLAMAEDDTLTISEADFLANASDVDGDTLSVSGLTVDGETQTLVNNGDGTWTYTPSTNFNGTVGLSYSISDGTVETTASADIAVAAVNDAPNTSGDSASTSEDTAVTVLGLDTAGQRQRYRWRYTFNFRRFQRGERRCRS